MSNHFVRFLCEMRKWLVFVLVYLVCACNPCRYGCEEGICVRGTCDCFDWYEGDACERLITSIHVGQYAGDLLDASNDTVIANLSFGLFTAEESAPNAMLMQEEGVQLLFTDRYRFIIGEQSWRNYTVTGEGEILFNGLGFRLELADSNKQITTYAFLERAE